MKPGDIVKYSHPSKGEGEFRFVLLHLEKGKADIQLICDERIRPIETVEEKEIEPATMQADEMSGCFMVGNIEFAGEGRESDKERAEAFAKLMNCTPEQVRAQFAKNARQLQEMAEQARELNGLINGYTAEQLEALAQKAKAAA